MNRISVIGAGLAGCEAAWQLAKRGIFVDLYEMKPIKFSKAHKSKFFAELVCSNSFKSTSLSSASGMLKQEMKLLGSLTLKVAEETKVDAGQALAVDRELFSKKITEEIKSCNNIKIINKEVIKPPDGVVIFATGPLTSEALTQNLQNMIGGEKLYFYDAIAPIVYGETINYDRAFFGSRYDPLDRSYLNCTMDRKEYEEFYEELICAKTAKLHSFDIPKVYEGCMPIEVMAKRGKDTIRFGPLKPVGILDPANEKKWHAIVQLRKENLAASLFNMVGFQTNLTYSEQKRVFSKIPALENAEFLRYGTMHKNIFINSPTLLNNNLCLKQNENLFFAGQITGVEGYLESAATGIFVGRFLAEKIVNNKNFALPSCGMIASLISYITNEKNSKNFQPIAANFGIVPSLETKVKNKKEAHINLANRSIKNLKDIL